MVIQMNVKKLLVLLTLAFCFWSVVPLAFAQNEAGGPGGSSDKNDSNPGTASDIREDFYKRMKNAKSFSPRKYGGEDVVVDEESKGPGVVKHALTGPVQVWPVFVKEAISKVPTMRDQGIQRWPLKTFGYPISDTQYQVLHRYDQNIMLEQLFDPEKVIWVINAMGMIQTQSAANSAANLARNQSSSAIEYAEKYLPNFTTQAGNRWNTIRDKLFVPMAVLLLLPGAVLAQVKAIVAQGSPLFGDINPFEGIMRSIMAIFFIPATYLVVNYGIDVSNSMALTIRENYQRIFHSNMYKDAECAEKRAFGIRPKDSNDNGIFRKTKPTGKGAGDLQAWAAHERNSYDIYGPDPCKGGGGVNDLADETTPVLMNISRVAVNVANVGLAGTWNVMCAFQLAYLHYLFLMGPIVAALWVWPIDAFRKALGSWIEGVLIICFWALFWNTTILLMACFRNVCVTGTVIMTALNVLSIYSVQHAFNFLGLVQAAGREAASAAQEAGAQAAGGAMAHGAKHGAGAQGAAISKAAGEGHAVSQAEKATGIPGGGPGAAGAMKAAGIGPGGMTLGGGGGAPGGVASGSGGPAGHGGAGGASSFQGGAASPNTSTSHGAGPGVTPPPGSMNAGSPQVSAGGGPGGHGPAAGAPPTFGQGNAGASGAAGHGGTSGSAGHSGATTPGSSGGQGTQQPGVLGQSGSHSSSMSSQSNSSLSKDQAASVNPPPGQGLSTGATHSAAHGANVSAQQANELHSNPPNANLHQGQTNANLGLNVHEGSHSATSHSTFGSTSEISSSLHVNQPPSEVAGGFVNAPMPTDIAAAMSGGGFSAPDIIANMPPTADFTNFVADQPPPIVNTQEVQNVQTEMQTVNQEVVTQEVQTILPSDVQTSIAQEVQSFVQDQPQQQFLEQPPASIASGDSPTYTAGLEQHRVNVDAEQTFVSQETIASNQIASNQIASNQTVSENTVSGGAVSAGGLQSNVQAAGSGNTAFTDKGQQIPSNLIPPAGASSALMRAMGPGMGQSTQPSGASATPARQDDPFGRVARHGGYNEDTEELASMPPPPANLGEAGQLADAEAGAAAQGHEGFAKGSTPQDRQPQKPQLAREDADENESYT